MLITTNKMNSKQPFKWKHLKRTNDSWRVDETYIKVNGKWKYLYRAVDSNGETLDFMLSAKRDKKAAKRFFIKTLSKIKLNNEVGMDWVKRNFATWE